MSQELLYSLLRKLLTVLGTFLVQKGWVGENDMIEIAGGLAVLLVSVYLSWQSNRQNEKTLKVGIAAQPGTSVEAVKAFAKSTPQANNPPFDPVLRP